MIPVLETPEFQSPDPRPNPSPTRSRTPRRSPSPTRSRTPRRSPSPTRSRTPRRPRLDLDPSLDPQVMRAEAGAASSGGVVEVNATPPGPDEGLPSVREAAQALADAGAAGASRRRNATENDWAEFLAAAAGFLSMLLVWWLVAGRGMIKSQRREYELSDEEAEGVAGPAARILARSWVNVRYGKHVLGAADYIVLALTLSEYTERIAPLVKARLADLRRPPSPSPRAGARGPAAPAPTQTSPPPQEHDDGLVARPVAPWQPLLHVHGAGST